MVSYAGPRQTSSGILGNTFMGSLPKASTVVDDDLDHAMVTSTAVADIATAVAVPRHLIYLLEAVAANLMG
jgi:hypothetical protein